MRGARVMAMLLILCCPLAFAPALAPGAKGKPKPKCLGQVAGVVGTDKSETLKLGGKKGHVVVAWGGADRIIGSGQTDLICAGAGNDRIVGGGRRDRIDADRGTDRIAGGGGADLINGGRDADRISAGGGGDRITPGGGKDVVSGGAGTDTILGSRGNDSLSGGADADKLVGQIGDDRLRGGNGNDELVGEAGSDRIRAGGGDDRISGEAGEDVIGAGDGIDLVLAGPGGDEVLAGPGADRVLGGPGGDLIQGEAGDDRIFGELVDDQLEGGDGDDVLSGGHGVDDIYGGAGDDRLRGDLNRDFHWGDAGNDTVSYATATPPGPSGAVDGVKVDLSIERAYEDPQPSSGDPESAEELVAGIENVVGSGFDDSLTGAGAGSAQGLGGMETCSGFATNDCDAQVVAQPTVSLDQGLDPGLLVRGGLGDQPDALTLKATEGAFVVSSALPVAPGPGCGSGGQGVVTCPRPAAPIGYVTVWGGGGGDQIELGEGFADTTVAVLDGGDGSDQLSGASGSEVLLAGPSGADRLAAGGGDDALFTGPGGDGLDGGDGSDQLVTSTPCDGHDLSGGQGAGDIAGFAQTLDFGVTARLGGAATIVGMPNCLPTTIRFDNEILEGTPNADVLYGNGRANPLILGNEGDDVIYGLGGADILNGERGVDELYGGGGRDLLEAFDGTRDSVLSCGHGGKRVVRDPIDPKAGSCRNAKHKRKKHRNKR